MANIVIYDPADPSVTNRVTSYLTSVNTPNYNGVTDKLVNPDLSGLGGVPWMNWKVSGATVVEMSTAEKDACHLDKNKAARITEVDRRTEELIFEGFEYPAASGNIFSLSLEAQNSWEGLLSRRDDGITYPVTVNLLDDSGNLDLADSAAVKAFYDAGWDAVRSIKDGGTTLKTSIRAATTQVALDAVVDNR